MVRDLCWYLVLGVLAWNGTLRLVASWVVATAVVGFKCDHLCAIRKLLWVVSSNLLVFFVVVEVVINHQSSTLLLGMSFAVQSMPAVIASCFLVLLMVVRIGSRCVW